jgi:NADPH:quinone reductase-like Zn-dependent oxidoreductase
MRAVGVREFGGADALEVVDVPEPHAGPGEIRIRVHAATVNPTDTGLRAGLYGSRMKSEPPHVPGMDAAGVVDEVGPNADWHVGDEVMAIVLPPSRAAVPTPTESSCRRTRWPANRATPTSPPRRPSR